jgi:hypothetical protein
MGARHAVLLTPLESAHPRPLLSYKQNAPVGHSLSVPCSLSQTIVNTTTLSPVESALARLLRTAHSKGLIATRNFTQRLYLLHLRDFRESAHSKEFITPVESALARNSPATPLESALTKIAGVGAPVFKKLTSAAARCLRQSYARGVSPDRVGAPPRWITLLLFFQPPTFNFRSKIPIGSGLSTFFSHARFPALTSLLPCRAPLQSLRFHQGEK